MKKQLFKKSLIAMLSIAVLMSACKKDENNTEEKEEEVVETEVVISVPDTHLAAGIKTRLKLGANDNITSKNILLLDTLNLDKKIDLSDLTGLEAATNLAYLHLGETNITSLAPIKNLKKVKYLRLNDTKISDLSPIADYTTLTYFNANTAALITDISPLSKNVGLQELIVRRIVFGNAGLATIAKFTKLYRLNIRQTGVTDISAIAELMSKGALLKTTAGVENLGSGDASLDLQGLTISNCNLLDPYRNNIVKIDGACFAL